MNWQRQPISRGRGSRSSPCLEVLEDRTVPSGVPFARGAGGLLADVGRAVAADSRGDVYVAGKIQLTSPAAAASGAFVAKYSPIGTPVWTQHIFGDVTDDASAVAVGKLGNVYVTGTFRGVTTFDPAHVLTPTSGTSYNGFIEKLDTKGHVLWVREIDAPNAAGGTGIALDANDNVYTTGYLYGSARFFGPNGQQVTNPKLTNQGSSFLVKQDTDGNLLWVQQFGIADPNGSGGDLSSPAAIAVNPAGDALYVAGAFRGANVQFGTNANTPDALSAQGTTDLFTEKFDAQGNAVWAVRAGSPTVLEGTAEAASGIALDSHGNPYITGSFDNTADFGNLHLTGTNGPNTYVAKLDPASGAFVKAVSFADSALEVGTAIAVDAADNIYATGWFEQTATFGPFQLSSRGDDDVYVAKLDTNLNVVQVGQMGGAGRDRAWGIAADAGGYVDVTGSFTGTGQFSAPPVTLQSAGDTDVFVSRSRLETPHVRVTVIDGHILQLLGDDQANRIVITDDRHFGIRVTINDGAAMTYAGIDKVVVDTGAGRDNLVFQLGGPDTVPADLQVRLGNGADMLLVDARNGWYAPLDHPWHIDVTGGTGVDRSTFQFGGAMGKVDLEDQLAAKKNTVDVTIIPGATVARGASGDLRLNFFSGGGTDVVRAMIGTGGPATARTILDTPLALSLTGGSGHHTMDVIYQNVEIIAVQSLFCPDDNTFRMQFHNVVPNAPLQVSFRGTGGPGRGDPGSTVGIQDVEQMPVPLDGTLTMTDRGSPLGDDIRVIYDFNPQPEPPAKPQDFRGNIEFHVPHGDPWAVFFEFTPAQKVG